MLNWPKLIINCNNEIQIEFPMNRPYEFEIINLMKTAGFKCVGKSYNLIHRIRELYFKDV